MGQKEQWLMVKLKPGAKIFQLRFTLLRISPEIWRRVLAPGNLTLADLHETIVGAMGWSGHHLHEFLIGCRTWADPDNPPCDEFLSERATKGKLKFLGLSPGDSFIYRYDFGDDWVHEILVEDILEPVPGEVYPELVAGERACPPEDCGGVSGYLRLVEGLGERQRRGHLEALPGGQRFDPERFDMSTAMMRLPVLLTYS